jgi:hypothetical protein
VTGILSSPKYLLFHKLRLSIFVVLFSAIKFVGTARNNPHCINYVQNTNWHSFSVST